MTLFRIGEGTGRIVALARARLRTGRWRRRTVCKMVPEGRTHRQPRKRIKPPAAGVAIRRTITPAAINTSGWAARWCANRYRIVYGSRLWPAGPIGYALLAAGFRAGRG